MKVSSVIICGFAIFSSGQFCCGQDCLAESLSNGAVKVLAALSPRRVPQCRDGKDNDHDGKRDYPRDKGCKSRNDNDEREPKPRPTPTPTPSATPGDGPYGDGASLNGLQLYPANNPWNKDISTDEVDTNSNNLLASIGLDTELHPDFGTIYNGAPNGIPYTVVSPSQAKVNVLFEYADESDVGPYPIPLNPPIEGGPNGTGDRHILMLDRDSQLLYELYSVQLVGNQWRAGSGAIFNLRSNTLRPAGWTSADAAGLPILPGLVRYDEVVERGEINHALRFTCRSTRRAYLPPATHYASSSHDVNLPPMGMRVRLKSSVNISSYSAAAQVILRALKRYGMFMADNGSDWFISGAPDSRWSDDELNSIRGIKGKDFEVVKMEGLVSN